MDKVSLLMLFGFALVEAAPNASLVTHLPGFKGNSVSSPSMERSADRVDDPNSEFYIHPNENPALHTTLLASASF
ncbi:hypothetical protein V6N12_007392 [Hibiscus sabdariffa]|uniref:Uncharacterized protein n=1 Tax=Hibiscus sabdariffa TaxID=183260 RepID=A0ABR2F1N8_9ROSI